MSLAIGTKLGPYEIVAALGAGGMGEVYKARDTRLDRTVAIKILPPDLAVDPERRQRFEREAKAISQLSHPHICALYDVGEAVQPGLESPIARDAAQAFGSAPVSLSYLVMEYLAGETLATRLAKGSLPVDESLRIGAEIADALAAAHRQGIIHRDLKPANVMLTKSGVKLLDFGLAKLKAQATQPALASAAPTRSDPLTARGTIVGTLQYMSPEQLENRDADARTDLFALGAVLYEMLTGRRAFAGTSPASVITAIMSSEPAAIATLRPLAPPALDRVVGRCLAKDPEARWQSAADLAQELRWLEQAGRSPATPLPGTRWSRVATSVVVLVVVAAATAIVWERLVRRLPEARPSRVTLSLAAAGLTLTGGGIAISPDGLTVVFAARAGDDAPRLYARRLDEWEPRALKGTAGAISPFFSPDGEWVAFVASGMLQKVQLREGAAQSICRITYQGVSRGYWGTDGRILFSQWPGGLSSVSAEGGTPQPVASPADAAPYVWPHLLPGGKTLLFTLVQRGHASIAALTLATGVVRTLVESGSCARYLPTGHMVYESEGHLRAVAFDLDRLEMRGASRVVIDDVAIGPMLTAPNLDYDVSATGTVVYLPSSTPKSTLVWRDRSGSTVPLKLTPRGYAFPSLSSDGRQLTVTVEEWPVMNVGVASVEGEPLSRLTSLNDGACSVFSPDREWVAFASAEDGWFNLFRIRADGSGQAERLLRASRNQKPTSWSPRGNLILFNEQDESTDRDIVQIEMGRASVSRPFGTTPSNELEAVFSPDGRWVAYQSDESGKWEIYVRPHPGPGVRRQISLDGGMGPVWNPQGGELFYQTQTALMAVRIQNGMAAGAPKKLFSCRKSLDYRREFDVSPDGQRFLFMEPATSRTEIDVISNWFDELRARVPTGR